MKHNLPDNIDNGIEVTNPIAPESQPITGWKSATARADEPAREAALEPEPEFAPEHARKDAPALENSEIEDAAEVALEPEPESVANDNGQEAEPEEYLIKKRKKRRHRRKTRTVMKVLIVIAAVIAAVLIGAFAFLQYGAWQVNVPYETPDLPTKRIVEYEGEQYAFNEDMVTILVIGHDDEADTSLGKRPNEADAIVALAIDLSSGKLSVIGIPRDTICLVDQYSRDEFVRSTKEQICLAYGYRDTPELGSENVVKSASSVLLNVPIKYYYALDEAAIAELNDAVGGVSLVPLQTIPGTDIVEGEKTVLLGQSAHEYVQWRDTTQLESSKDRQERDVQYLKALASQILSDSNGTAKKITDLVSIISEYSVTNISPSEFTYLANVIAGGDNSDIDVTTLKGTMTLKDQFAEFEIDEDALYKTILDTYYVKVS